MKFLRDFKNLAVAPSAKSQADDSPTATDAQPHSNFPHGPQPIDFEKLLRQLDGKSDFVMILLEAFDMQGNKDIVALHEAFYVSDAAQVVTLAHSLKGAAATLGAEPIRLQAAQLEVLARSGDLKNARACMTKLVIEFDRYRRYVSSIRSQ